MLKSVAMVVHGFDLLGQAFEEHTSTIALNLQGCRYASKHHLPKNTWVTLEVPEDPGHRSVRARVAWIQRPHSVREFFQVAVELESPANIWNIDSPPADWKLEETSGAAEESVISGKQDADKNSERGGESPITADANAPVEERAPSDMKILSWNSGSDKSSEDAERAAGTNPLLKSWQSEMDQQVIRATETAVTRATEKIREAAEQFQREQHDAQRTFSEELASKERLLTELRSEFERSARQSRELSEDLERTAAALRAEKEAAIESAARMSQARLGMEAAEASLDKRVPEPAKDGAALAAGESADLRGHLDSEIARAKTQWDELLQSSLDSSIERLVGEISRHSQDVLRATEQRMSERVAELRQPFGTMQSEARDALAELKPALDQELGRVRSALAEMEQAASRVKEYSAELDATTHNALDELHRRLENILQSQTEELNRRGESLAAGVPQRLGSTLDALGNHLVERVTQEVETKVAPRLEHASELVRHLTARELEGEESLRLHRERMRQVSESSQREAAGQAAATLASLRNDFEEARKEALIRWSEELEAAGVRASHTAAESIGRSSEWFQQEARARLQVLTEQALAEAGASLEEKTATTGRHFDAALEIQSAGQLAKVYERIESVAAEIAGRTRTEIERASEAAASSFGQVLRSISEQQGQQFLSENRSAIEQRQQDLKQFASELLLNLETGAGTSIDRFHAQMASELEASVSEGRRFLSAEFASALDGYRTEREAYHADWLRNLERASDEATQKYQERLQRASDSWVDSSVRELSEHGQGAIETLVRSADQAVRDSCSKLFEGFSELLRERVGNPPGRGGLGDEPAETPPQNKSSLGASA
ncbi:MAG TPA: hypothetical protein VN788_14030 [Verrucomicrobiae bacterium]|nr:hypothetical protein [Verrucomicrobiae bacterium]